MTLEQRKTDTKLAIIIDPPEQTPEQVSVRVGHFVENGGMGVLIGGSGPIENNLFQDTVAAITETVRQKAPIWILPGHLDQIPNNNKGITGFFNYSQILGSRGNDFDTVYPPYIREFVSNRLKDRGIPSISTLYILCGDPNASVSKVSGILPLDLSISSTQQRLLKDVNYWLSEGVNCIFFEAGSGSDKAADNNATKFVRHSIDNLKADTMLFVSGGIKEPEQVKLFSGVADYVVVGGHFERNGAKDTANFIQSLRG